MEVVEAEMADVDLYFLFLSFFLFIELLSNLEEALFDLLFNLWFQLFLLVVELQFLPFKVLERISTLLIGLLSVLHDGLFTVRDDRLSVLSHIL